MVFFNYSTMQMHAKVVYYGPGLCGKTTNLQFIYDKTGNESRGEMVSLATETDRTLFFDLLPIDVGKIAGFTTRIQLYTVPGQVFYNTTRKLVLKGVDGVVFVADSQRPMLKANVESFQNLEENLDEMGLDLETIPVVLQYNKRDLDNILTVEELEESLNKGGWPSVESSALNGDGVFETLKTISKATLIALKNRMTKGGATAKKPAAAPKKAMPAQAPPKKPLPAAPPAKDGGTASRPMPAPAPAPETAAETETAPPAAHDVEPQAVEAEEIAPQQVEAPDEPAEIDFEVEPEVEEVEIEADDEPDVDTSPQLEPEPEAEPEPEPEAEPEPIAAAPEPAPEPEPVAAAPEPAPEPQPVATAPAPAPEPVAAAPEPTPEPAPEPAPAPQPAQPKKKKRRRVDALAELEKLRESTLRPKSSKAARAARANGRQEVRRELELALGDALGRARRFSLTLQVEDSERRQLLDEARRLTVDIDDPGDIEQLLLRLNIALRSSAS